MSGKTLAATCAGMVVGINRKQLSSRNTLSFLSDYFTTSTFPFIWDDPTKDAEVKQVAVDLGDGALRGKTSKEECRVPMTGCLVTANFNLAEVTKYYSRICLIKFKKVDKIKQSGEGPDLQKAAEEASCALPTLITLARDTTAIEIRHQVSRLQEDFKADIDIRILEGIAIPLTVAKKVLKLANVEQMDHHLDTFINDVMAYHQASTGPTSTVAAPAATSDDTSVLIQLLNKAVLLPMEQVNTFLKLSTTKLFVQMDGASNICDINKCDLRQEIKNRGGRSYGCSVRFNNGKVRKGASIEISSMSLEEQEKLTDVFAREDNDIAHSSPDSLHQNTEQALPQDIAQSPQPLDNERAQSPQPLDNERPQSPQPLDNKRAQSPQRLDNERAQSPRPLDNERAQSPQPLDNERAQSPQPLDNERAQSPQPLDNEIAQSPQPLDNERAQSPQPLDNERAQSPQPLDNERAQSPQPLDEKAQSPLHAVHSLPSSVRQSSNKRTRANRSDKAKVTGTTHGIFNIVQKETTQEQPSKGRTTKKVTYCICGKASSGKMVGCDNTNCNKEWFHFKCMGIRANPRGCWYCPNCRGSSSRVPASEI